MEPLTFDVLSLFETPPSAKLQPAARTFKDSRFDRFGASRTNFFAFRFPGDLRFEMGEKAAVDLYGPLLILGSNPGSVEDFSSEAFRIDAPFFRFALVPLDPMFNLCGREGF